MIKTGIIGATGYAGQQLVSLLINHPEAEVTFVSSNSYAGQSFSDIYPQFYRILDQKLLSTEEAKAAIGDVDVVFTALPNGLVFEIAEIAMEKGTKIVDFSADFRLDDPAVYEEWYKTKHTAPQLVSRQVYGLPELWRDRIRNAQLVANPGCYTTASILAVSALLREEGLADKKHIIIDAKSGITGSGRKANVSLLYAEAGESIKAYGIANHRHTPEIEEQLSLAAGEEMLINFTPHLVPMNRGILITAYASLKSTLQPDGTRAFPSYEEVRAAYDKYYDKEKFVRVLDKNVCPETKWVEGSNYVDVNFKIDERTGRVIMMGAMDNLVKGAAGQAVQNMNLMFGLPETKGLELVPMFP